MVAEADNEFRARVPFNDTSVPFVCSVVNPICADKPGPARCIRGRFPVSTPALKERPGPRHAMAVLNAISQRTGP